MMFNRERGVPLWAGSISEEMHLGSESRIMPHVLMVIPQQLSHGKLQPLQCFTPVKHKDSLTMTGLHPCTANTDRIYHYRHSELLILTLGILWRFSALWFFPGKFSQERQSSPIWDCFQLGEKKKKEERIYQQHYIRDRNSLFDSLACKQQEETNTFI